MPVRERIMNVLDPDSPFLEIQPYAGYGTNNSSRNTNFSSIIFLFSKYCSDLVSKFDLNIGAIFSVFIGINKLTMFYYGNILALILPILRCIIKQYKKFLC